MVDPVAGAEPVPPASGADAAQDAGASEVADRPALLRLRSTQGRLALTSTIVASSTAFLDATIANVAVPHIGRDLDAPLSSLQWVITGYLLTLASLILLGGVLGDRYGRRRIFRLGAAVFAAASVGCAVAPTVEVLIAARLLQGLGGALLTPTSLALVQASFVPEDRGAAVGAWSGLGGVATAIGPFLGGWLVDGAGWRWAFLLNLPLVALVVASSRALPATDAEQRTACGFDVIGSLLVTASLGGLTWALFRGPVAGWTAPSVLGVGLAAVALGATFVARERRAAVPLVPRGLFASRTFTVLNLATFSLYAALSAQGFLLVYHLQVTAGWTALAAGAAMVPATVVMLVGSARSGAIGARLGPRPQLIVGPIVVTAASLLLSTIDEDADWWRDVLPGALLFGVGLVTFVAPLTASVMGAVGDHLVSTASGVNNAVARTGALLAVAVVPSVAGLGSATGADALTTAFRHGMWVVAGLALASALISAAWLPRRTVAPAEPVGGR